MSGKFPMTKEEYEMLKKELERLKKEERPRVVQAIAEARAHGDLSENAEYDAAKEEQGLLEAKIREIEGKLANAEIIEPNKIQSDTIMFGATVTVIDADTDEEKVYKIVGEYIYDLAKGEIPYNSPIAQALIGHKAGDWVEVDTPSGIKEFEIVKVEYK
jgi:transcription elongation factor GreA